MQMMNDVRLRYPAGHYYSPIVDPALISDYIARERAAGDRTLPGLHLPVQEMAAFWQDNLPFIRSTPFAAGPGAADRYYYRNDSFGRGDAIILRAVMNAARPRKIIEVGSGFSTACMLDSASHAGLDGLELVCIDPNPERMRRLLRAEDFDKLELVHDIVQNVPLDRFQQLGNGDILFIDSTHVLKSGSDVHYELFHVLPGLAPGVMIHFHDIQFPFEYPDPWLFEENVSWNEIYALRAFLMYNTAFKITFFNNLFGRSCKELVRSSFPDLALFPQNFGGSLWLRKVA